MKRLRSTIPIWTILSAALIPVMALSGILAAVILDALVDRPEGGGSVTTLLPGVAYGTALVMKVCLVEGVVLVPIVLVRREGPRSVPLFGLITNAFLIGMFRHFEFYKLGFDQDRWAAP